MNSNASRICKYIYLNHILSEKISIKECLDKGRVALSLSIYINITQAVSDWDTSPLHHLHYSSGWTLNVFSFGYSNQGQWQLLIKCKTFAIFVSLTMIWVLILSRMKRGKKCSIDIGRILGKNEHDGSKLSSQIFLSISNVTSQEK